MAAKRASLRSASMLPSGCATPSEVSPTATPMWRRPKSNASTVPPTAGGSVRGEDAELVDMPRGSGMPCLVRQARVGHAQQLHGGRQAFFGGQIENDLIGRRHGQPGVLFDLVFQLTGRPA